MGSWLMGFFEEQSPAIVCTASVLIVGCSVALWGGRKIPSKRKLKEPIKKRVVACPFSKDTDFIISLAENVSPAPLDLFEDWVSPENRVPLAARWLAAGISGQDTPGILRAGLKRLRDGKYFLVEELHRLPEELALKKEALDDPKRHPVVFVAEPCSLEAQKEVLELFVQYLPRRYPDLYSVDKESITVKPISATYLFSDWAKRPLELCERIVQEDLVLMRPDSAYFEKTPAPTHSYFMSAAAVIFSFNELPPKLGKPAEWIHAPVPGFAKHIQKSINLTFSRLPPERPMWRNNWAIAPNGNLDEPLYGSADSHAHRSMAKLTVEDVKSKFLKVEYQTIRRLPKSGYLLFTIKTMADSMAELEKVPKAAACLAASMRGMSSAMHKYKGIENQETCNAILEYLDSISK